MYDCYLEHNQQEFWIILAVGYPSKSTAITVDCVGECQILSKNLS